MFIYTRDRYWSVVSCAAGTVICPNLLRHSSPEMKWFPEDLSPRGGPCVSGSFWPEEVSLVSRVYGFPVERCLSSVERAARLQCRYLHLTDREREWQCSPWKEVVQLILRVLGSGPKHAVSDQLVSAPFFVCRGALSFSSHYSSTLNCLNWDKIVLSLRLLLWVNKLLRTESPLFRLLPCSTQCFSRADVCVLPRLHVSSRQWLELCFCGCCPGFTQDEG